MSQHTQHYLQLESMRAQEAQRRQVRRHGQIGDQAIACLAMFVIGLLIGGGLS